MLDGKFAGKIENDLIKKYFGGSSSVFYGFTGSTGALTNTQKIRFNRSELYNLKEYYGNKLTLDEMRNISKNDFGGLESNKAKK